MTDNGGHNDYNCRYRSIAYLDKLKGVQEWNQPRQENQPGTVAPPFLWLDTVQNCPVNPRKTCVYGTGNRGNQRYHRKAEGCKICQKKVEIVTFNIRHERESAVTDAIKYLQRFAERLAALVFGSFTCFTHFYSSSFFSFLQRRIYFLP